MCQIEIILLTLMKDSNKFKVLIILYNLVLIDNTYYLAFRLKYLINHHIFMYVLYIKGMIALALNNIPTESSIIFVR